MRPRSVCYYIDANAVGGAERVILSLLEHLDRNAWLPSLLCHSTPATEPFVARARALDVPVIDVPPLPLGAAGAWRVGGLARLLRRDHPDVFHAHLPWPLSGKFALAAAVVARVPGTVATVHAVPTFHLDSSNRVQLRLLAHFVDAYIASSDGIARELASTLQWPRHKIHVVPNGVDIDAFAVTPSRELRRTLAPDQRPVVFTAARLVPDKGIRYLVEASVELPEASIVIAGDGPERPDLEALVRTLGVEDRVQFLGHRDDMAALVAVCDLFVSPTLWEGVQRPNPTRRKDPDEFLPLSILEAMAASKPVVMSRLDGGDAIIDGVNGFHVPPRDAREIAATVRTLLSDPALCRRIGERAHTTVRESFSLKSTVGRTEALYGSVLATP